MVEDAGENEDPDNTCSMFLQIGMYIYNASPNTNVYMYRHIRPHTGISIPGWTSCAFLQREEVDKAKPNAVLFNLDTERPRNISERWEPHSPIDCCEIQRDTTLISGYSPLPLDWSLAFPQNSVKI